MPSYLAALNAKMGTLGLILFVLPLAAPLIAQDTSPSVPESAECHHYDESCATGDEGCHSKEYCATPDQNSFMRCFVTWTNTSTAGVVVAHKGCIYHDPSCSEKCVSQKHVKENGSEMDSTIFYCCCYGSNCNKDFFWEPKELPTNPPTPVVKDSGWMIQAILLILGSLILLFALTASLFYYYRKKKMASFIELPTVDNTGSCSHPLPSFGNICSKPIQLLEVKAQGRFGAVWKATYCGNYIAVKIFPQQDYRSWVTEKRVLSMPHLKHENILSFIGADEKGGDGPNNKEYWLITAYYDNGSLYDYLKGNTVTWAELCRLGESIGRGLAFLHCDSLNNNNNNSAAGGLSAGSKPTIAHRDFKSKNVLVKPNLTACIADFGLALTFYPGCVPSEIQSQVGTRRYMAPEVLEGAICFHRDAFLPIDMYACSLVLWELLSRCSDQDGPVSEYALPFEAEVGQHPTLDDMQDCVVTRRVRPPVNNPAWRGHPGLLCVAQLIAETWDHDAEARLSASCIVERFAQMSRVSYVGSSAPFLPPPPSDASLPPGYKDASNYN